jgi:hypothetical protein
MKAKLHVLIPVWLLLMFGGIAGAQSLPSPPQASDFNLEITNLMSTRYVASVPTDGHQAGVYGTWNLRHIADWKPSAEVPSAAGVIKVTFWLEQDSVRVEVLAYLGEIAPNSRPPDWQKLPQMKIASRLVRLDETISIDETQRVGIQLFQVKLVRAAPWSIGPPEVINKTQALNVESTTEERPAYTVTVRNVSTKNISAIMWYGIENDRKGGGGGVQGGLLVRAGKEFQIQQHFSNSQEKRADESNSELPRKRQIVIAAVLFEDGSFEGEPDTAATMAAGWSAEAQQLSRIIPLLQSAAASGDPDQTASLAKLKNDIGALSEEVDTAQVAKLLTRFPNLSSEQQRIVNVGFKGGLRVAKHNMLNEIERLEYERAHAAVAKDVRTWAEQMIAKYQKLQSPYQ